MGQDKALRSFLGQPLIQRIVRRLAPLASDLLIVTHQPDAYRFLGVPLAADLLPDRGPLGGLYTALQLAARPYVAMVGCDMPFVQAGLLAHALAVLREENADIVAPLSAHGLEPLHAVYRRDTCRPAAYAALLAGQLRLTGWLETCNLRVRTLTPDEVKPFDPAERAFCNVNTPEEFAEAERWALAEPGLRDP